MNEPIAPWLGVGSTNVLLQRASVLYGCDVCTIDITQEVRKLVAKVTRRYPSGESIVFFSDPHLNNVVLSWCNSSTIPIKLSTMVLLKSNKAQYVWVSTKGVFQQELTSSLLQLRKVFATPASNKTADMRQLACVYPTDALKARRIRLFLAQNVSMLLSDTIWVFASDATNLTYSVIQPAQWTSCPTLTQLKPSCSTRSRPPQTRLHKLLDLRRKLLDSLCPSDLQVYFALQIIPLAHALLFFSKHGFVFDATSFTNGDLGEVYSLVEGNTHITEKHVNFTSKLPSHLRLRRPIETKEHNPQHGDGRCVHNRVRQLARSKYSSWWKVAVCGFSVNRLYLPFGFNATDATQVEYPAGLPVVFTKVESRSLSVNNVPICSDTSVEEIDALMIRVIEHQSVEEVCCKAQETVVCTVCRDITHHFNVRHVHLFVVLILIHLSIPLSLDEIVSIATRITVLFYGDNRTYEQTDLQHVIAIYDREWKKKWQQKRSL